MREEAEAIFNTDPCLAVDGRMIEYLKERAATAPRKRFRLCLHRSPEDTVQQMIIALDEGSYCRPHVHPTSPASIMILEGEMTFVTFDGRGAIAEKVELGPRGSEKDFCVRIDPGVAHMDVPKATPVVMFETMGGPFVRGESNVFADWAPAEADESAVHDLLERVEQWRGGTG